MAKWQRRLIKVGENIPAFGTYENYSEYPYINPIIKMFDAWKSKNYGELSNLLKKMFPDIVSDNKRAGKCREVFQNKDLISFEIISVEEKACSLSCIIVEAKWKSSDIMHNENLTFGCSYEGEGKSLGLPWNNNGKWVIIPWEIGGLYK